MRWLLLASLVSLAMSSACDREALPVVLADLADAAPDIGCPQGTTNCGHQCADLTSAPNHCGSCGYVCSSSAHAFPRCTEGKCVLDCVQGFNDCDGDVLNGCEASGDCLCSMGFADCNNDPGDGCETNITSDTNNCGGCGKPCVGIPGSACVRGMCVIITCTPGLTLCSGVCVNTRTDPRNCTACDLVCALPNAVQGCHNRGCFVAGCMFGFEDCNADPKDGCEVNATIDDKNCGACLNPCGPGLVCSNSVCSCPPGLTSCNGKCVDTKTDPFNCSGCGKACMPGFACMAGRCTDCGFNVDVCGIVCVNTFTDSKNCGGCGIVCPANTVCDGGYCCQPPQKGCRQGCVDLMTDPNHCGDCDTSCIAPQRCVNGKCM